MKMDKQALKKHHFWILLGVFTLLAVVLLVVIPIGVGGMIEGKEKAVEKQDKDLDANKSPKSQSYLAGLDVNKDKLGVQREKIHRYMYVLQKDLVAFPGDLYDKYKNKEFGSAVDLSDMIAFRDESMYLQQYRDMADIIKPTSYTPDWKTVLAPVEWSDRVAPSSEEVWLSVEDMCVRREVLRVLHDANEMLAEFQPADAGTTKLPFTRKFKSRLWELELTLDRKDRDYVFRGKLKNVSGRFQQIYEMDLYVWVQDKHSNTDWPKPVTLKILQDKLSAGEELTLPETKATGVNAPTGLFRVEQVLNARTVPIKRLTNLTLGLNAGHRLADRKLAMAKFSQPKEGEKPAGDASSTDSRGPSGGKGAPMTPMNMGGSGSGIGSYGGGGASDADRTPNGLTRARYVEVTDQVRRMPVALVVTVDQSDVPDLLVSLENTHRMRFQVTQYHWQRMHGMLSTPTQSGAGSAPAASGSGSS
ncbi:MAG: hypothetical protein ACJ8F7_23240, partial [Gemmataceae bacterium]